MTAFRWLSGALAALILTVSMAYGQASAPQAETPPASAAETVDNPVGTILELLSDPAVVAELVERLGRNAADTVRDAADDVADAPEQGVDAAEEAPSNPISFGRSIAITTSDAAMSVASTVESYWIGLSQLPRVFTRAARAADGALLIEVLRSLGLIILVTYGVYLVLKLSVRGLHQRIGTVAERYGFSLTLALLCVSLLIDLVVVGLSVAAGYAVTALTATNGSVDLTKSLYLNAFVVVQTGKIIVRALFAPRVRGLRLTGLPDRGARLATRWLITSILLIGYGQLLIEPIINRGVSVFSGNAVGTLFSLAAVIYTIYMLLRHRNAMVEYLFGAPQERTTLRRRAGALMWIPALIYLLGLLVIVATRPAGIMLPLLQTTGIIIGSGLVAFLLVRMLSDIISSGISLPDAVTERFPLLERRLNGIIPRTLMGLRLIIILAVIAVMLDLTGFADIGGWLTSPAGLNVLGIALTVFFVLLVATIIWVTFSSWVEYRLNPNFGSVPTAREKTLLSLARNAFAIVLLAITLMIVLSELGLNIGPLIASAGVLGLAIGFGAQKMVQDVITGVFIQFENAINVGDVISVGGITGAVEKLTVRSVSIRDLHGVFHIIPFSSVDLVSNYMREFSYFVADMGIAYREDIAEAKQSMFDAFDELKQSELGLEILGDFEWFGLNTFGDSAIVLRARIKTLPGQQWGVGRAYNEIIKRLFDERSIEIPYPHQTIYFGEDKQGNAPPLHVRSASDQQEALPEPELVVEEAPQEPNSAVEGDDAERKTDGRQAMPDTDGN